MNVPATTATHTLTIAGPRLTGDRCKCPTCGLLFANTHSFDGHRLGSFKDDGARRHCLTLESIKQSPGWSISNGFCRLLG